MKRSTVTKTLLPALLLQLLLPAGAGASYNKNPSHHDDGQIQRTVDKEPSQRDRGPVQRFRYQAPNDFLIEVHSWPAENGGFTASAALIAPTGERMTFEFSPDAGFGPSVLVDGSLVLSYGTARDGRIRSLSVHDGERAVTSYRSRSGKVNADAYLHLVEGLIAGHSPEFLDQMTVAMNALRSETVPTGAREFIECMLGVTGYVISIWGLIGGCTVLGVPTLGASCLMAILAHEVATASAVLGCFPN